MTVKIKTLLLGTTIASLLSLGQADALTLSNPFAKKSTPTAQDSGQGGSVPAEHENFKSTYIYPLTKKTVALINSAKSDKEAQDKLCGKSLMSSGIMRQNGGAICKKTPHSAMMSLALCEGYPKFDGTDCAQGAKELLWGKENAKKPLSQLMQQPMRQEISVRRISVDKFSNEFDGTNENAGRTFSEELQYYANPLRITAQKLKGYGMTNIRYLLCNSKRENLPQTFRILAAETCYEGPIQGASKMQPNSPEMMEEDVNLTPYDTGTDTALDQVQENRAASGRASGTSQRPMVGALKGMNDGRTPLGSEDWNQPEYGLDENNLEQAPKVSPAAPASLRKSLEICSVKVDGNQNLTDIDLKILLETPTPATDKRIVDTKKRLSSRLSQGTQAGGTGTLITEAKNLCSAIKGMTAAMKADASPSANEVQSPLAKKAPIDKPAWMVKKPEMQNQTNMPENVSKICNSLARANATDIKNALEPIFYDSIDSNPSIDEKTKNGIAADLLSSELPKLRKAGQFICNKLGANKLGG